MTLASHELLLLLPWKLKGQWMGGGLLKAIGGEHGFDTQEGYQVGKRDVSAAHTSRVPSSSHCHIREREARKSAQECKMSLMSRRTSPRKCLHTAPLCSRSALVFFLNVSIPLTAALRCFVFENQGGCNWNCILNSVFITSDRGLTFIHPFSNSA